MTGPATTEALKLTATIVASLPPEQLQALLEELASRLADPARSPAPTAWQRVAAWYLRGAALAIEHRSPIEPSTPCAEVRP